MKIFLSTLYHLRCLSFILSVERLIMQAEEMREQGKKFAKINGIPIVYSDKLSEKPINALLGKKILKKLSIINGIVER